MATEPPKMLLIIPIRAVSLLYFGSLLNQLFDLLIIHSLGWIVDILGKRIKIPNLIQINCLLGILMGKDFMSLILPLYPREDLMYNLKLGV